MIAGFLRSSAVTGLKQRSCCKRSFYLPLSDILRGVKMHLFPSPPSLCAWHQHSDVWQSLMWVLVHSDNVCLLFSHNSSALQQQSQTQPSPAGTTELNTEHPKTLCRLSIMQQYQPTSSAASSAHSALQGGSRAQFTHLQPHQRSCNTNTSPLLL